MYRYRIESFKRVIAPENSTRKLWYEYVIANSVNTITGCRAGSYNSVFDFVIECTAKLNQYYVPCDKKVYSPVYETNKMIEMGIK